MSQTDPESPYDFRDPERAAAWEAQIKSETWRGPFLATISAALNARYSAPYTLLELGSGPGHLARAIRSSTSVSDYTAVDYSPAMHELARNHLGLLSAGVRFEVRDFRRPDWTQGLGPFDAAVTFMAAHEVRRSENLAPLFAQVATTLKPRGLFLFADFYATDPSQADLYLTREEQSAALAACGFEGVRRLLDEHDMALHAATCPEVGPDGGPRG